MDSRNTRAPESPAADAAGLLLRIGFGLIVLVAPVAALFFRRAFIVLVPVGALLIIIAALLREGSGLFGKIRGSILSPTGLAVLAFVLWSILSLVWTPFPAAAAERLFRTVGIFLMAVAVVAALPERMRASNLHLMTLGIAAATLALIISSAFFQGVTRPLLDPEAPNTARAAVAASVMVWPAVAWTFLRGKDVQAFALIAVSGLAIAASGSVGATIVALCALTAFLAARSRPQMTANALACLFGLLVLLAPALTYLSRFVAYNFRLRPETAVYETGLWADVISQAPLRIITGHGFDTAFRAVLSGMIDAQVPRGLLSDAWFELGLVGAVTLAVAIFLGFRSLGRCAPAVAAPALAVTTAIVIFAFIDLTSTQIWWLCVLVVAAVTLVAVNNGQYRTRRPAASMKSEPGSARHPDAKIER